MFMLCNLDPCYTWVWPVLKKQGAVCAGGDQHLRGKGRRIAASTKATWTVELDPLKKNPQSVKQKSSD